MGGILHCLQTGGLRLNDPVAGIGKVPLALRHQLEDAGYLTASRFFDTAIQEHVHAVLLVGSTTGSPLPGSRAPWFLNHEFRRLQQQGIAVIVRSDDLPPAPPGLTWPNNVHLVSPQLATGVRMRDGQLVHCCDARGSLHFRESDSHRIVFADTVPSTALLSQSPQTYWACGIGSGDSLRYLVTGVPQSGGFDSPSNAAPVWFALQSDQVTSSRRIACEAVGWHTEAVDITAVSTGDDFQEMLAGRLRRIASHAAVPTLVRFRLSGQSDALITLTDDVMHQLQQRDWGLVWPVETDINARSIQLVETHAWPVAREILSDLLAATPINLSEQCEIPVGQTRADLRIVPRSGTSAIEDRILKRLLWDLTASARSA